MKRKVYEVVYHGIDKENRIDCLAQIREQQNPPGHTPLDIDGLCKGRRSAREDATRPEIPPRESGKFVRLDGIFDENFEIIEKKTKEQTFKDSLKVSVEPVAAKNIANSGITIEEKDLGIE